MSAALNGDGDYDQQLMLDDPVIEVIKRTLIISSRIGLEPLSRKFARIALKCKRRMAMKLTEVSAEKDYLKMKVVKKGIDVNECPFAIPWIKMKAVFRALFRRIPKWRSIDFTEFISAGRPFYETTDSDEIIAHLLTAILAECGVTTDVQRLLKWRLSAVNVQKLTEFVRCNAANLRHLTLSLVNDDDQPPMPLIDFAQAICSCQELRRLKIGHARPKQFPPDFLSQVLALPRLTSLRLGNTPTQLDIIDMTDEDATEHVFHRRQCPGLPLFSINRNWLPEIDRLTGLSMFKNMQHFKLLANSDEEVLVAVVGRIVAEMRSPASVDLDSNYAHSHITWQNIFNDYLPLVCKTGANVERNLFDSGLPVISAGDFADGLATMPSIVRNALTVPDLTTAPIKHGCYQKLVFSFSGGAKLTVQEIFPNME